MDITVFPLSLFPGYERIHKVRVMPSVPGKVKYVCDKTGTQYKPSVCSNCSVVIYNTEKYPFEALLNLYPHWALALRSQAEIYFQLLEGNSSFVRRTDSPAFFFSFFFFGSFQDK